MKHEAMKSVDTDVWIHGPRVTIWDLQFCINIDIVAKSQDQLQELTDKVNKSSKKWFGLKINAQKTKTMTS